MSKVQDTDNIVRLTPRRSPQPEPPHVTHLVLRRSLRPPRLRRRRDRQARQGAARLRDRRTGQGARARTASTAPRCPTICAIRSSKPISAIARRGTRCRPRRTGRSSATNASRRCANRSARGRKCRDSCGSKTTKTIEAGRLSRSTISSTNRGPDVWVTGNLYLSRKAASGKMPGHPDRAQPSCAEAPGRTAGHGRDLGEARLHRARHRPARPRRTAAASVQHREGLSEGVPRRPAGLLLPLQPQPATFARRRQPDGLDGLGPDARRRCPARPARGRQGSRHPARARSPAAAIRRP